MQCCTKDFMFLDVPVTSPVSIMIIMRSAPPRGTGA